MIHCEMFYQDLLTGATENVGPAGSSGPTDLN